MTTIFTACDSQTGQVLYTGTADNPKYLETNEVVIYEGKSFDGGWIDNGVHFELPSKPNEFSRFDYITKQWVDLRTIEGQWSGVKRYRNQLLTDSDWTQLPDVTIETKSAWATYRQQLRDITNQPDPFNITWPTSP